MGVNGRQTEHASWLVKLYWRSSCGRTLSPNTELCLNCGDRRPDIDTQHVYNELIHEHGPRPQTLLHSIIDAIFRPGEGVQ